jgi:hypothetical protein
VSGPDVGGRCITAGNRRARFGWDYWGDESLGTVELPEEAA